MDLATILSFLIIVFACYILFNSYFVQVRFRKYISRKSFVLDFRDRVKGRFHSEGHYNIHSDFLTSVEYKKLKRRTRVDYRSCYDAILFKTQDADWELFFVLERHGIKYKERVILRAFPYHLRIKSEGTVERSMSQLNMYSNNRYLSGVIEGPEMNGLFHDILKVHSDILHIYENNLFCNLKFRDDLTVDFLMEVVSKMHVIRNKVYRKGIMEY